LRAQQANQFDQSFEPGPFVREFHKNAVEYPNRWRSFPRHSAYDNQFRKSLFFLTGLIHNLHDTVINEKILTSDSARFFHQITRLRQRLRLIAIIQTCSSLAFIFDLPAMISLYFGIDSLGSWLFFLSIILMVAAMIQFTIEFQIANSALDVHLSDREKHQEW
jgi:hypothetical protein